MRQKVPLVFVGKLSAIDGFIFFSFISYQSAKNKPRISNAILKETCHILCIVSIHHGVQHLLRSVLKLHFSRQCRMPDHFSSLYRMSLPSKKTSSRPAEKSWFQGQGSKSVIHRLTPTAALPLPQLPSICPPAPHPTANTKARKSPYAPQQRTRCSGLGIPQGKVVFHRLLLNSLKTFANKKVPNPTSASTVKSQRAMATKGKAGENVLVFFLVLWTEIYCRKN